MNFFLPAFFLLFLSVSFFSLASCENERTSKEMEVVGFFSCFLAFFLSSHYTKLYSFKFNCNIVSLTAAKTKRMFSVSGKLFDGCYSKFTFFHFAH